MPDERTPEQVAAELSEIDAALVSGDDVVTSPAGPTASEIEAGRHGWVPKELFKGDPSKWKPAQEYIDDGLRYNKNIKRELEGLKSKYSELEQVGQKFAQYHEEQMKKKDQEIVDAITETRRAMRAATRDGDDALADTLEARIDLLQEERVEVKKQLEAKPVPEQPQVDPVVREWVEDGNEWFDTNPVLRTAALEIGKEFAAAGTYPKGRKFLDAVTARIKEDFPRHFKKEEPVRRADQVGSGADRLTGATGHTIHDLPPADQALMREFIAKGWTTKEKFLANYFNEGKKTHRTK